MDAEADAAGREVGRGSVEEHPLFEHDDAVEVGGDRAELVRHEQHGGVVLADKVDEGVAEQPLRFGVDAGDRLVENQQLGVGHEGLGDERTLLLAAREFGHQPVGEIARVRPPSSACSTASRSAWVGRRHQARRDSRPPATTSRTVVGSSGASRPRWGTYPSRPGSVEGPGRVAEQLDRPVAGRRSPSRRRSRVDFPEPFGPDQGHELSGRQGEVRRRRHDGRRVVGERQAAGERGRAVA